MQGAIQVLDSFRRARMIDSLTSDDDKLTPLYRIEEFCDLLQSSSYDVVKEMVDYLIKRLDHKSPYVKFKVLRVAKNAIQKGGKDVKREIQKHSSAMRALFHYKAPPDALKGDAPSKAVREMAQEAIQTLFSADDSKPANSETGRRKMEGFGSTYVNPSPVNRTNGSSFDSVRGMGRGSVPSFSNILELGSTSIKQGLNLIRDVAQSSGAVGSANRSFPGLSSSLNSDISSDNYQSPNFNNHHDSKYGGFDSYDSSRLNDYSHEQNHQNSNTVSSQSSYFGKDEEGPRNGSVQEEAMDLSEEFKLVENITMQGGVRLQPTRESLQSFVSSIMKLNSELIAGALEKKLKSHAWQVRMKAMCALEAILRQIGDSACDEIAYIFETDPSSLIACYESPQASLREKSKRVLELLGYFQQKNQSPSEPTSNTKPEPTILPDLIDTHDPETLPQDNQTPDMSSLLFSPEKSPAPASTPASVSNTPIGNDLMGNVFSSTSPSSPSPSAVNKKETFELFDSLSIHQSAPSASSINAFDQEYVQTSESNLFHGLNLNDEGNNDASSSLSSFKTNPHSRNALEDLMYSSTPTSFPPPTSLNMQSQINPKPNAQPINNLTTDVFQSMSLLSQSNVSNPSPFPPNSAQFQYSQFAALTTQQQMLIQQQMIQQQMMYMQAMGTNFNPSQTLLTSFSPAPMLFSPAMGGTSGTVPGVNIGLKSQPGYSHPDGFDFSGDPSVRSSPTSDAKKENDIKAFDFVAEQMRSAKSKSSLRS